MIRVERGWDAKEGEQDGKSRAAKRTLPIIDRLAPIFAAHRLARSEGEEDALIFGAAPQHPFDLSSVRRRALKAWGWRETTNSKPRPGEPRRTWVKAGTDALEPIGLHEARHTFASLMIAAGVNAKALSTIMGHATIGTTFDVYGHLMPGGETEARERVDAYLARMDGPRHLRTVGA